MSREQVVEYLICSTRRLMYSLDVDVYRAGNGQMLFPLVCKGGGISTDSIFYFVCKVESKYYSYGVKYPSLLSKEELEKEFYTCLVRFLKLLGEGRAKEINLDGGDLGAGDNL